MNYWKGVEVVEVENEVQRAIEVLKTAHDCHRLNYWPHGCDKCPHTEKCYTTREHQKAVETAIAALERHAKEPCEISQYVEGCEDCQFCAQVAEPEPRALTVEELLGRINMPVYIINNSVHPQNCRSCWEIISSVNDEILYLKGANHYCYRIDNYGKTWLAYDREMKGV